MKMLGLGISLLAFALWLDGYHARQRPTPDDLYGVAAEECPPYDQCTPKASWNSPDCKCWDSK